MQIIHGIEEKIKSIILKCLESEVKIVTAESCTGGMLAACITSVSGASKIFDRGFVTYSNDSKIEMLNVGQNTIKDFGAVSKETAMEMARGALTNSNAQVGVSITGIAGPTAEGSEKPIGTVYVCIINAKKADLKNKKYNFLGARGDVRKETIISTVSEIIEII